MCSRALLILACDLAADTPNFRGRNFNCNDNEGHLVVQNPGYAHLGDLGWNDKISSIRCQRI